MTELIRSNGGSALVLATSAEGGKAYAHALRSALDVPVYDQWSSAGASVLRHNFTSNESSVLVATRGMMTGLDVPGDALSLVIIDRIPRAPMNAVDNARADLISSDGVSGFLEQDDVYGSDAAVLLEQAAGRLIRSISDTGMVALLDPRISPKSDLTNKRNPSYRYYKQIIKPFGTKLSSTDDAVSWLADQFAQRSRS
nr:helicase C-terminal domain-containing protein [Brevibacterium antiquum]